MNALVGENESGKTAILRAMWKSKNVADARFDKLVDYPLDRYAKERAALKQMSESLPLWDSNFVSAMVTLNATIDAFIAEDASRHHVGQSERQRLKDIIVAAQQGDPATTPRIWGRDNIPSFIYFDDYGQLTTRIHLPTYLRKVASTDHDAQTRTQSALFEWSSIDPQEILNLGKPNDGSETEDQVQRRKDERRVLLDYASFSLSGDWVSLWPEMVHRLHFDVDGEDFVLWVSDEHNQFGIRFEERSQGFQWFFSFYLVFLVELKSS